MVGAGQLESHLPRVGMAAKSTLGEKPERAGNTFHELMPSGVLIQACWSGPRMTAETELGAGLAF